MSRPFSEVVIEGPFMLVKGFLLGFLSVTSPHGRYFFHRKTGIRRETLKEFLKDLFELDTHVHLCIQSDLVESFKNAAVLYKEATGNEIQSIKPINSASFTFAYEFYNEESALLAKELFAKISDGVQLVDYFPYEHREERGIGVEAYAPLHEFTARAKGTVMGDFEGVIEQYLKIKRSDLSEAIICGEVRLALD